MLLLLSLTLQDAVSVEVTGSVKKVVEALRQAGGGNIHLEAADAPGEHELILKNVKLETALRWTAWLWSLELETQDGVHVLRHPYLAKKVATRTYDLRGVPKMPADRPGPRLTLAPGGTAGLLLEAPPEWGEADSLGEMIQDLLKENVAPGTWEGNLRMEKLIEPELLVTHTPAAHAGIAWVLDSLRSFAPLAVTVTAEFRDAAGAPAAAILQPAEIEAAADAFRQGARLTATGVDSQRVHGTASRKMNGIVGYVKGEAIRENRIVEASVLDVAATRRDGGKRIALDLLISHGGSRELEPIRTPAGLLPLHRRAAFELGTSVVVPNGGGAILHLPGGMACLIRASSSAEPRPAARVADPPAEDSALRARLEALPPADIAFTEAPMREFAAWLRRVSGLNVVVASNLVDYKVSGTLKALPPAKILDLLLTNRGLSVFARDEALLISAGDPRLVRLAFVEARDVALSPPDYPLTPDEERGSFTGADLANLLKNTLHRESWEEADGKSIMYIDGLLILRNSAEVLKDSLAFVESRRAFKTRQVLLEAEAVDLPAEEVAKLLDPGGLLDEERLPKVRAGALHERIAWFAREGQRTSLRWTRSHDHLADYDGDDPIRRENALSSRIELVARAGEGGVRIDLTYEDPRLIGFMDVQVRGGLSAQSPLTHTASSRATTLLPPGKRAVLRWNLPEGKERLLVLRADVLTK